MSTACWGYTGIDRVSIHERPKKVDTSTEGGHWEGDLIICRRDHFGHAGGVRSGRTGAAQG
jgi:hypothetical protein